MDSGKTREVVMSNQDETSKTHKPVMILHLQSFVLRKRSKLQRVLHRRCPDENIPHTLLMLLAARKESPSVRQQCPIRTKTPRQAKWSWSRILLHNLPGQPLLLPRTCYQERWTPSLGIRTGLSKPETRRTNQVEAGAFPVPRQRSPVIMTDVL